MAFFIYDFAICRRVFLCVFVLVLVVCILTIQRSGVCVSVDCVHPNYAEARCVLIVFISS